MGSRVAVVHLVLTGRDNGQVEDQAESGKVARSGLSSRPMEFVRSSLDDSDCRGGQLQVLSGWSQNSLMSSSASSCDKPTR